MGAEPATVVAAPPRRGLGRAASIILAVTAVLAVSVLAGVVYGLTTGNRDNRANPGVGAPSASSPANTPSASAGPVTVIADPLTAERDWRVVVDPANKAACEFDGALVVKKATAGPYRCPGPRRLLTDFTATVTTRLLTGDGCAAIWLRFDKISAESSKEAGYVLAVCPDRYALMTHGLEGTSDMTELTSFPYEEPVPQGDPIAVGITADGPQWTFTRDGEQLGTWKDTKFASGRLVFGVLNMTTDRSPARVSFNDVEIRA